MTCLTTIDIHNEYLHFSAAHFTIFSATERERLHGHNFSVSAEITAQVNDDGLCADYALFKNALKLLCNTLDEYTHIAEQSPHLSIKQDHDYYSVCFNQETMMLLKSDTQLLPIRNTTVEEYSRYLINQMVSDTVLMESCPIESIVLKVSSGPGQSGASTWNR